MSGSRDCSLICGPGGIFQPECQRKPGVLLIFLGDLHFLKINILIITILSNNEAVVQC